MTLNFCLLIWILGFGKQQDVMPYRVSRRIDESDMLVECVKEKCRGKGRERKGRKKRERRSEINREIRS